MMKARAFSRTEWRYRGFATERRRGCRLAVCGRQHTDAMCVVIILLLPIAPLPSPVVLRTLRRDFLLLFASS